MRSLSASILSIPKAYVCSGGDARLRRIIGALAFALADRRARCACRYRRSRALPACPSALLPGLCDIGVCKGASRAPGCASCDSLLAGSGGVIRLAPSSVRAACAGPLRPVFAPRTRSGSSEPSTGSDVTRPICEPFFTGRPAARSSSSFSKLFGVRSS